PAKAGTQMHRVRRKVWISSLPLRRMYARHCASSAPSNCWVPAFAGMTIFSSFFLDHLDSTGAGDDEGRGEVKKKTVVDYAGNDVERDGEQGSIADSTETAVIDHVPAVGDEFVAERHRHVPV